MSIDEQAGIVPENPVESIEHAVMDEIEKEDASKGGFGFTLPDWVWIEASTEPLDPTYTEHPLNFKKSAGLAQIIRGFTAVFGSALNYWWMDVIMGFMKMRTEGKGQ